MGGYLWQQTGSGIISFLLPAALVITGINIFSLAANIPGDSWTGGNGKGFMGFSGHQNTLASAILFILPSLFSKTINPLAKKKSWMILLITNLIILFLTFSRGAVLALICGVIVFLVLNKKWAILINSSAALMLIFCLIWFLPSLKTDVNKFIKKDFPAFYSTREWMWIPSYEAAIKGGLTGIGYGISNPEIIVPGTGSHYENGRYIREKGNSFLGLLEETGIIGFILFILPLLYILLKNRGEVFRHPEYRLLIASLSTFIFHSQFEAWMVGVGSIQLPLFFFYLGSIINPKQQLNESKQHE